MADSKYILNQILKAKTHSYTHARMLTRTHTHTHSSWWINDIFNGLRNGSNDEDDDDE